MSSNSDAQPTPTTTSNRPAARERADDEAQQWANWLRRTATDSAEMWDEDYDTAQTEADGATHLLDLVAAVEYLARGHRAGFTVWDALEEAIRWWANEHELLHYGALEPADDEWIANSGPKTNDEGLDDLGVAGNGPALDIPDLARSDPAPNASASLGYTLRRFADLLTGRDAPTAAIALDQAVRHWVATMANRRNASHHWPHPSPRRLFPPPTFDRSQGDL